MSDAPRPASQTPYAFGTMTFVFGLAIGAVLGALYFMSEDADPVPATDAPTEQLLIAAENEVEAREAEINGLVEENIRLSQELEAAIEGQGEIEAGQIEAVRQELAAKQAEIDSLTSELGAAYEELGRVQGASERYSQFVNWVVVLEEMHSFAEGGFLNAETFVAPALEDALEQINEPVVTDAVIVGIVESDPSDTAPFYAGLQEVLNRMQEAFSAP